MEKTTLDKAIQWVGTGSIGMNSKTMWCCFMELKDYEINYPYDPDDFSRCYKLLQAVPEWKTELHKLKGLSAEWSNLVDNWDRLTEMYEQNVKEGWVNRNIIGMYELMTKLTR